jgi:citrate lyase beta subunit
MALNQVMQFVSGNHSSLRKILTFPAAPKNTVIIDFEDALQDVLSTERSSRLKAEARLGLLSLLQSPYFARNKLALNFRINSIRENEFHHDIEFLQEISKIHSLAVLFLPKVNSHREWDVYLNSFYKNGLQAKELIPIIETVSGYYDMKNIFSQPPTDLFHRAAWGHYDYNLDAGCFPFMSYESAPYWTLTCKLIRTIEDSGYSYVHGAILDLANESLARSICAALSSLCHRPFDAVALSYRQTLLLAELGNTSPPELPQVRPEEEYATDEKIDLAKRIVSEFQQCCLEKNSFAIHANSRKIISPQEYLAAVNFLNTKVPAND